jgi:hypothetical protein
MLTIAHATSLAEEDRLPFEHGVAMARRSRARLVSVTANPASVEPQAIPSAGEVLARWGLGADEVGHERIMHDCCDDPIDTLLDALGNLAPDLLIAGTHQRSGLARILSASRAEALAANVTCPTLVFPVGAEGFLAGAGELALQTIVVPCGDRAAAQLAIDKARRLVEILGVVPPELVLLHAVEKNDHADLSDLMLPEGWAVRRMLTHDALEHALSESGGAGCIISMATRGHDSFADVVMGSHTDRALRVARCPILVVPIP